MSRLSLSSEEAALNMKNVELNAGFKHLKEIVFFFYNYVCAVTVFCVDAHPF